MIDILREHWLLLLIGQYPNGPLGGLAMTLIMAFGSLALAIPASVLLALARTSRFRRLASVCKWLVDLVRCVPLLMFIFWAYFVIPLLTRQPLGGASTMVIALVVYESAYLSEIIRAGIQSLPSGQLDAARSLGMGYWVSMRHIVLPQALMTMSPSLVTQLGSTIKETSLAYIISAQEITFAAAQLNGLLLVRPLEVFGVLALVFFVLVGSLTLLAKTLEIKLHAQHGLHRTA